MAIKARLMEAAAVPYCWRVFRRAAKPTATLAAGGRGEPRPLSESDWGSVLAALGRRLKPKGLIFRRSGYYRRPLNGN